MLKATAQWTTGNQSLKSATAHDLSLVQTFALSWEQVENETTQKAFIMAGFLAPNTAIPLEIFENTLECSQELCDEILEELFGLGLLRKIDDYTPAIHPLLAEFARRLDAEITNLALLSEKLTGIANGRNHEVDRTGNYALYTPILPHVRSIAEKAEGAQIEKSGVLWNSLGFHIYYLADYAGAKAAFERALKIDEAAFGPDHPSVAIRVNNLGSVLKDLGDHAGAKAAFERALKIDEAAFGPDHPNVAIRVNNLGGVLQELGDHAGAKAAYERALKIDEAAFGPDHPSVRHSYQQPGLSAARAGRPRRSQSRL